MKNKPELYIITNNHFDPTWRRCWDRRITFRGEKFASYADIEEYYLEDNLTLAREHSGYRFDAESAVVVRKYLERHPDRLPELRKLASEGRFAVTGAGDNIIDTNMVLGESIVRNFLTGLLWVEETLGLTTRLGVRNDGFGNSAQVPQIFRGCEIAWVTGFSYSPVQGRYWRGLDGSTICCAEIPTVAVGGGCDKYHPCPKCDGYGCKHCRGRGIQPDLLSRLPEIVDEERLMQAGQGMVRLTPEELLPNPAILDWAKAMGRKYDTRFALQEGLLPLVAEWVDRVDSPPEEEVHPGLELNPNNSGVLVTRIKLKQECRRQEYALLAVESLSALAALAGAKYPRKALSGVWQPLLFTMFHDAITATHVDPAYEELRDMQRDVDKWTSRLRERAFEKLDVSKARVVSVVNPFGTPATEVVSAVVDGDAGEVGLTGPDRQPVPLLSTQPAGKGKAAVQFLAVDVPPLSAQVYSLSRGAAAAKVKKRKKPHIENDRFCIDADEQGILSILDKRLEREVLKAGEYRPNEMILEHDEGSPWATLHPDRSRTPLAPYTRLVSVESSDAFERMTFRCIAPIREHAGWEWLSTVTLVRGLERVEFATDVRWDTFHRRLRIAMPVAAAGAHFYGIPYGMIERTPYPPESGNWAGANGDWPAVNWAGVQGPEFSVALLNRGLPSYCIEPHPGSDVILLSVLRSPATPTYLHEPQYYTMTEYDGMRDAGEHHFEYALTAYAGPFAESAVVPDAEGYNGGLLAVPGRVKLPAGPRVDSEHVRLAALKWAEKGQGLVVRLAEFRGREGTALVSVPNGVKEVCRVNLLERREEPLEVVDGSIQVPMRAWEIATLRMDV